MRHELRYLTLFAAALAGACGVDLPIPSGAVVTCTTSAECPEGSACVVDLGVCASAGRPCVEAVGGDLRSAANGNACTTASGSAGTCRNGSCTVCGDAVVDPGEACDDGNTVNDDACLADCTANTCGDGFLNPGVEECDDGNGVDTDACLTTCRANVCGDLIINVGVETCEDGNDDDNDGCGRCVLTTWAVTETVGYGPWGGDLATVDFGNIGDIAIDPAGNIYVSDTFTDVIWRVEAGSRRARIYAGRTPVADDENQPAMRARFSTPSGLAVDRLGNLFVADRFNRRIVRIDYRTQLVNRVAGNYACFSGNCGDGGPALDAGMGEPLDVTVDGDGGLYVTDGLLTTGAESGRLRYVHPDGNIYGSRGVTSPAGVAAFADNSVYYTETGFSPSRHLLTSWTPSAGFALRAGDTACATPTSSCGDGAAGGARFNYPVSIATTSDGATVFIADRNNNKIRRYRASAVSTIAGTGASCTGDCDTAANAVTVGVDSPSAVAIGPDGAVYFAESARRLKRLVPEGATYRLETVGGSRLAEPVYSRTAATASAFVESRALAAADDGTWFVAESPSRRLYRIDPDGLIYRLSGDAAPCGDLSKACGDGQRADSVSVLYADNSGLASDPVGNLYFIDGPTGRLRRIDRATNILSTVAGNGTPCATSTAPCGDGGPAQSASFSGPSDLYATADGSVYVADGAGFRIRRVDPAGNIGTVLGTGVACAGPASCGDGGAVSGATLQGPRAILVTPAGDLYVLDGDSGNTTLRRVAAGATTIERLFPAANLAGSGGLAFDPVAQSLLVAFDGEVRRFAVGGAVSSFAGVTDGVGCTGASEGVSATAWCIGAVVDVARAGNGDVFLANYDGGVFRVSASGILSTALGRVDPFGTGAFDAGNLTRPRQLVRAPLSAGADTWWVANGVNVAAVDNARQRIDALAGYAFGPTVDGTSARYRAPFANASGLALDAQASPPRLYVADAAENLVYRIDLANPADSRTWTVSRYAGDGLVGQDDGARLTSSFDQPTGLAFDAGDGTLYVADRGNHVIRAITDAGVTTVAGVVDVGLADFDVVSGVPIASAHFFLPEGVMVEARADGPANLLVADTGNHQVRRVDRVAGRVFVVAGDGTPAIAGSGTARFAGITSPRSLATDSFGNLFIASGFTVRQVFAGADGIATGDDELTTIYGNSRIDAPMSATSCLSGIGVEPGDAELSLVDVCAGFYVRLGRTAR